MGGPGSASSILRRVIIISIKNHITSYIVYHDYSTSYIIYIYYISYVLLNTILLHIVRILTRVRLVHTEESNHYIKNYIILYIHITYQISYITLNTILVHSVGILTRVSLVKTEGSDHHTPFIEAYIHL